MIVSILLGGEAREHVLQVGHGLLDLRLGHHRSGGRRPTCCLSATHALAQLALSRGKLGGHAGQGTLSTYRFRLLLLPIVLIDVALDEDLVRLLLLRLLLPSLCLDGA